MLPQTSFGDRNDAMHTNGEENCALCALTHTHTHTHTHTNECEGFRGAIPFQRMRFANICLYLHIYEEIDLCLKIRIRNAKKGTHSHPSGGFESEGIWHGRQRGAI